MPPAPLVTVAGHCCLDLIPSLQNWTSALAERLRPGSLAEVGSVTLATGGAVSNTGLALHRLGVPAQLMAKIGDDLFGDAILRIFRGFAPGLADGMLVTPGAHTSYTIALNPPGFDRTFLHYPAANDTLAAADLRYERLVGTAIFHFGYPPLLRRFYADHGEQLETVFRRARDAGVVTSLDMAMPDPHSPSGQADWRAILTRALPLVDVFLPSLDEMLFMLRRPAATQVTGELLSGVSSELLNLGAAVVGLKLGDRGLYLRTTGDMQRLAPLARAAGAALACPTPPATSAPLASWCGRELLTPCFRVQVAGTTGCGDCTIAGFLAGLLHGLALEDALTAAVAVGACGAEQLDATSGIPPWPAVQQRIATGWPKHAVPALSPGWRANNSGTLAVGPHDRAPKV